MIGGRRHCPKCGQDKPPFCFAEEPMAVDGLNRWCRACQVVDQIPAIAGLRDAIVERLWEPTYCFQAKKAPRLDQLDRNGLTPRTLRRRLQANRRRMS